MRFRDIEFRWSDSNNKHELVKWYADCTKKEIKEYCCVVAFFDMDEVGGYNMRTIGDRFFEDKDAWIVAKYALEFLNAIFDIMKEEEELK